MVLKCKSLSCVELFCCFCSSIFLLSISCSVLYMIYFQYNPKWTRDLNDLTNKPDNFGIRISLQSKVRSINNKKVMVMTKNGLQHEMKVNNINDDVEDSDSFEEQLLNDSKGTKIMSRNTEVQQNETCVYLHFNNTWKYLLLWEVVMIIAGLVVICTPCIGSRTRRRSLSWMLVTMHSNISGYIWVTYYILTYSVCWNSYAETDGSINWDYIQLLILGTLRIAVSFVISITGAIGNAKLYIPGARMSPYEVSDFILHLKSLNPSLMVSLSTLGSSLASRYASRISDEVELTGKKEFFPCRWYDYTNAYEDIANIIFPQNTDDSASGVMIYIDLTVCAHTEDAQADLNHFLLTFSQEHGRRVAIVDTTKYSLSAAIEPIVNGNSRVSRNLRRWSCLCCTCAKTFLRRGFVLKNTNRLLIYATDEGNTTFNIIAAIGSALDMLCLSGFATFLWLHLHKSTYRVHIKKAYSSRNGTEDSRVNEDLLHDVISDMGHANRASSPVAHSPPPTYDSAVATDRRDDLMKRLKTYFGISHSRTENMMSPQTRLTQNVCGDDVSGLPTYEEARVLRMKGESTEDLNFDTVG